MGQYIGARYVPRFMGTFDPTQAYENLDVVDNGLGTSYISKAMTPPGTSLTDTTYWALYGASSGAIINLQNQIGDLSDLTTTDYSSLVNAINELDSDLAPIKGAYVTPEYFGAVGDGVTDDRDAIKLAIESGLPVMFRQGTTYKCNSWIRLQNNNVLKGNGATILFDASATLQSSSNIDGYNISNVLIDGLTFDFGNGSTLHHGISIFSSSKITINNCIFKNCYGYVFRLNDDTQVTITNCNFKDITGASGNPGGAIYGESWVDFIIDNCHADTIDDHFVYITGHSKNIKINNCSVRNGGQGVDAPGSAYCIYADAGNVVISNCSDINCAKGGIHLAEYGNYTIAPHDVTIINHYSEGNGEFPIESHGDATRPLKNIVIANCILKNSVSRPIRFVYGEKLVIKNNIFEESIDMGAITLGFWDNAIIEGNIITTPTDYPIVLGPSEQYTDHIIIANNTFNGCTDSCVYARRVTTAPTIHGNIVTNTAKLVNGLSNFIGQALLQANMRSIEFGDSTTPKIHNKGDIIFNANPSSGDPVGWICNGYGAPGTLVPFGTV